MQIRFTNYKKVYIILGTFIFLLAALYIVSIIVRRNRENVIKTSQLNTGNTSYQDINSTDGTKTEMEASLIKFLLSKTELIADSVNGHTVNFLEDPVFQAINKDLLDKIAVEMHPFDTPINVEFRKVIVNSDMRSGRTYVTFTDNSGKTGYFEFIYSQNVKNEWKLVDFIASKPIQLEKEPTVNP
jgi:hypothetical protein